MKKNLLIVLATGIAGITYAQNNISIANTNETNKVVTAQADSVSLDKTVYDFGKIPQGKPVTIDFTITNKGEEVLVISDIETGCGCTTPKWNREPVMKGNSTTINVGYNAAALGTFNRPITIKYNGNKSKVIIIKGEVWKPEGTAANKAATDLKKDIF